MDMNEMLSILDNAIEGNPNSCLSEHARKLAEVREYLATAPAVVANAPPPPPPPDLKLFYVDITLSDNFLAADENEAWERALDMISSRKGMTIQTHKIGEVT
jgi:hypothetical protein